MRLCKHSARKTTSLYKKPINWQAVSAIATLLAFIAAAVYAYFAYQQVRAMAKTLTETRKVADAAATQAAASLHQAAAAESQVETNRELAKQTETANRLTVNALRANVQVARLTCSTAPHALAPNTDIWLTFQNVGKSTAEFFQFAAKFGNPNGPFVPTGQPSVVSIAPGATTESDRFALGRFLLGNPAQSLKAVINGNVSLEIKGSFKYTDTFGEQSGSFWYRYEPHTACTFHVVSEQ